LLGVAVLAAPAQGMDRAEDRQGGTTWTKKGRLLRPFLE
jgi:hypothetical protein